MSIQTQNRISDERLAEIGVAVCWRRHREGDRCVICDAIQMARELTALRASHKRLAEALEMMNALFDVGSRFYIKKLGASLTNADQAVIDKAFIYTANALAEARKLEGK